MIIDLSRGWIEKTGTEYETEEFEPPHMVKGYM